MEILGSPAKYQRTEDAPIVGFWISLLFTESRIPFSYLLCGGDGFVDELGQGDGDIVVDQPVGQSVILRASHVHNGDRHSRLCGHRHDACRGHDFQCGSDDPQFIGLRREAIRFFERAVRQCLAEIDHVGFDESVAWHIAAVWQSAMTVWVWFVVEIRHDVGGVVFCMAFHAVRGADGAMQIDDDVAAIACFFVQRVEILCGEQCEQSGLFQFDERLVRGARLRVPYGRFLLPTPGIHAVFFIGEECVDVIHFRLFRVLGPDTVRSAEVGNTCGPGNPRPRQYCNLYAHILGIAVFRERPKSVIRILQHRPLQWAYASSSRPTGIHPYRPSARL